MRITAFQNRNLTILSLSLGIIFFGFNAAEQHFTAFYQNIGLSNLAFQSLAILYAAIILGNLIGSTVVERLGIKLSLIVGYFMYVILVLGIVLKIPILIYIFSSLLGVGAGIAGIARAEFLRFTAPKVNRGEFAGATEAVRTFGGFIGILSVSLILKILNIQQIFVLLGIFMLFGVGLLLVLNPIRDNQIMPSESRNLQLMFKLVGSPKILLLLPYTISGGFLLGLVLGSIPVVIEKNFGLAWVGFITSFFHLTLAIFLMGAGYLSDIKGRFNLIYGSVLASIVAALIFLNFLTIPSLILVMILSGVGGSMGNGATTALMLDTFEEKIKEASAVLGSLGLIFGVVPSFLLAQSLRQNQLFILAIILSLIAIVCLRLFQTKYSPSRFNS